MGLGQVQKGAVLPAATATASAAAAAAAGAAAATPGDAEASWTGTPRGEWW